MMSQKVLKDEYQPRTDPQNCTQFPVDERQSDKENQEDYGKKFSCGLCHKKFQILYVLNNSENFFAL